LNLIFLVNLNSRNQLHSRAQIPQEAIEAERKPSNRSRYSNNNSNTRSHLNNHKHSQLNNVNEAATQEQQKIRARKTHFYQIRSHVINRQFKEARQYWQTSGFQPATCVEYNLLLQTLAQLGARHHCMALFEQMKARQVAPDRATYATVMGLHVKPQKSNNNTSTWSSKYDRHVVGEIKEDEESLSSANFNLSRLAELFAEMTRADVRPDRVVYDLLLAAYAKQGEAARREKMKLRKKLAATMRACMSAVRDVEEVTRMNAIMSNILSEHDIFRLTSSPGNLDKTTFSQLPSPLELVQQMRKEKIDLSIRSYNYMFMIYANAAKKTGINSNPDAIENERDVNSDERNDSKHLTSAEQRKRRDEVNNNTAESVSPLAEEMDESVESLCREMRARGYHFNHVTFACLIRYYIKRNLPNKVEEVFTAMKREVGPSVVAYNLLLTFYCRQGQPERMMQLSREMLNAGLSPDQYTIAAVCAIYSNATRYRKRSKLTERPGKSPPDAAMPIAANTIELPPLSSTTFPSSRTGSNSEPSFLIATEVNGKTDLTANGLLSFYRQLKGTGVRPAISIYNSFLGAFLKFRDYEAMNVLLADMTKEHVRRDVHTFNLFLSMYMFTRAFPMAERKHGVRQVLLQMRREKVLNDDVTRELRRKFWRACIRRHHVQLRKKSPHLLRAILASERKKSRHGRLLLELDE
jgi:pentatricopeptide repeat protein